MRRLGLDKKPKSLPKIQALASNGQCQLISLWVNLFGHLRQEISQILITRNDIADRTQYLNAQNTFTEAFNMGMIPIVNENDTIAVSEIRAIEKFGDNDTLSAITAAMVQADYLFLMTDVDCLYDKNPRVYSDARPIEVVDDTSALEADVSTAGSALGTGGMSTKIVAARLAASAGVTTIITRASNPGNILNIVSYLQSLKQPLNSHSSSTPSTPGPTSSNADDLLLSSSTSSLDGAQSKIPPTHTRFTPDPHPIRDRSFWLLHGLAPHGTIYIDEGAHRALSAKAGLLPAGILAVDGHFAQQEAVRLVVVRGSPPSLPPSVRPTLSSASSATTLVTGDTPQDTAIIKPPGETAAATAAAPAPPAITPHFPPGVDDVEGVPVPMFTDAATAKPHQEEVGRALVNYSAAEISRIRGCQSTEIHTRLGFADSEYVALRENISLTRLDKKKRGGFQPTLSEVSTRAVVQQQQGP